MPKSVACEMRMEKVRHSWLRASIAQWVKRWPADLMVLVRFPLVAESFFRVNSVPLTIVFHYHILFILT